MSAEPTLISTQAATSGVICAGGIVLDTLVKPFDTLRWGTTTFVDSIDSRVGGSAANTARALGILGVPVRLAGTLGDDQSATAIRRELLRCRVDGSFIETVSEPTAATVVLINQEGERQFLHRAGSSEAAFQNGLRFTPEFVAGITNFHMASLFVVPHLRTGAAAMVREARLAHLTTSLDTCWDPQGEWMRVLQPCLAELDILFINEDEARQLCGDRDAARAAKSMLGEGTHMVVIKQGDKGCTIYTAEEQIFCAAYVVEARDSTGAGDCFVAGFLAASLDGLSLKQRGLFGNAAGALSVQQIGAVDGLLPRAQIAPWMAKSHLR